MVTRQPIPCRTEWWTTDGQTHWMLIYAIGTFSWKTGQKNHLRPPPWTRINRAFSWTRPPLLHIICSSLHRVLTPPESLPIYALDQDLLHERRGGTICIIYWVDSASEPWKEACWEDARPKLLSLLDHHPAGYMHHWMPSRRENNEE